MICAYCLDTASDLLKGCTGRVCSLHLGCKNNT